MPQNLRFPEERVSLWREVAEELDLPSNDAVAVVLTAMKRADYITFPTTQRSLGVAGAHQQAAPLAAAITTPPQRSNAAT